MASSSQSEHENFGRELLAQTTTQILETASGFTGKCRSRLVCNALDANGYQLGADQNLMAQAKALDNTMHLLGTIISNLEMEIAQTQSQVLNVANGSKIKIENVFDLPSDLMRSSHVQPQQVADTVQRKRRPPVLSPDPVTISNNTNIPRINSGSGPNAMMIISSSSTNQVPSATDESVQRKRKPLAVSRVPANSNTNNTNNMSRIHSGSESDFEFSDQISSDDDEDGYQLHNDSRYCRICNKTFKTVASCVTHKNFAHGDVHPMDPDLATYACSYCPLKANGKKKTFTRRGGYTRHLGKYHSELKLFHCTHCTERFGTGRLLADHIDEHHKGDRKFAGR